MVLAPTSVARPTEPVLLPSEVVRRARVRGVKELQFDEKGLIAAVAQDRLSGEVRMVAWMNREALNATLATGKATFFSRSRQRLWVKGETSGHVMNVREVRADCDADTLLLLVDPQGPSCHTGAQNCFVTAIGMLQGEAQTARRSLQDKPSAQDEPSTPLAGAALWRLEDEIERRSTHSTAHKSYTRHLLDRGVSKINEKIREEAAELCVALDSESPERVASEAADVLYHVMVGLRARGVSLKQVVAALAARSGQSGHAEKASRQR